LITVGALLIVIIILMVLGGAAFLCLFMTDHSINSGPLLQKNYEYNGTLAGFDHVSVDASGFNGDIVVQEGNDGMFDVSVDAHGTQNDLDHYNVDFTQSGDAGTKVLKVSINTTPGLYIGSSRYSAKIVFTVPKGKIYDVTLDNANGLVELGAFDCDRVTLSTANGKVVSSANASTASYSTANGDIDVSTFSRSAGIKASTVNGRITVTVPRDAQVSIKANTMNGKIGTDLPVQVTEKGLFNFAAKSVNYSNGLDLDLSTLNGEIKINGQ
jgi:hypothetical protein